MPLRRFTLRSAAGIEVELVDLGAAVEVVRAPDRHGAVDDITLRLDDDEARTDHDRNPHLGITVGRFANRIGGARFELDGVVHELAANEGDNLLHGGADGFGRRRWEVVDTDDGDGEDGTPGKAPRRRPPHIAFVSRLQAWSASLAHFTLPALRAMRSRFVSGVFGPQRYWSNANLNNKAWT